MSTPRFRHFHHLDDAVVERLFLHSPQPVGHDDPTRVLALALGATLYVPGNRADLARTIERRFANGVTSMVIDLEDAVADDEEDHAAACAVAALDELADGPAAAMLLFVRTRTPERIPKIAAELGPGRTALSGFVLPKFTSAIARDGLDAVVRASEVLGKHLYAMPVLESPEIVYRETRDIELGSIAEILGEYRSHVLAARIGATDMCGMFGIRRDRDLTIYDVRVAADAIASIINYLGRAGDAGHIITGPVWEYFADHERLFRPTLRQTLFADHDAVLFRQHLVSRDIDGLLREIALDRANGMHGKTVIHPTHVAAVHALSAVTHEEYHDAVDIAGGDAGGVRTSTYRNKMNELKPHRRWAQGVLDRAHVFGVTNPNITFVDLLTALVPA
ncbi:MAG: HpcH/HpaI aldolase/citrate lyase family protein [Gordonia sp.]|jgi:citrate lyase beta subunit|uniref:HpcH/HpaI aldolase/citrate lyase family protein n=1 Tax=Gordonia sp. (in: high G+C Gram-positive bacteria) TaxID=84139 RepID=UPI001D9DFF2B|nr:HpcH/HpaI aldolase/citrate lyase family protein [Gordonia sp. (in: high G+C Gram-positive bacteria)]MCB1296736.1 HpcH/HpaI aldolase/citrate lyase family protein [Gordonia sp. (in: high G+C Gram-positive bacteria)]